jgi:predicted nucleic acid-binding protein
LSNIPLVYIDASVLAYAILPHDDNKEPSVRKARKFLKDIEVGKYRGIISTITEIEYVGAAKRLISKASNRKITLHEQSTAIKDFEEYTEQLGIGIGDSDSLAINGVASSDLFSDAKTMINNSFPYFHMHAGTWKNIGGTDALTVSLAIRLNAELFATFDRGFYGLNSPALKPLIIPDEYSDIS